MASKKKILLQFKYENQPWQTYDWTKVPKWAETQEQRMIAENPGAQYRRKVEA